MQSSSQVAIAASVNSVRRMVHGVKRGSEGLDQFQTLHHDNIGSLRFVRP